MLFRMKHPNLVILTSSQTLRRNLLFQPLTLHKRISWVSMLKTAETPGVDSFSECVNPQRVIVQVVTREEIFLQKVAIPWSFLKTVVSILQVLVRVTLPLIPG